MERHLFNKFLASIGIDSALLTLKLNSEYFSRGGVLEGKIKLEGGVIQQRIEKITVKLAELQQKGEDANWKTLSEAEFTGRIDIMPQETQERYFRLPIPDDTPITKGNYVTRSVKLMAEADILWAVNPRTYLNVRIVPEPEILILDVALRGLGFAEMRDDFSVGRLASDGMVKRIYDAPTALEDQITRAVLEVSVSGKHVRGHLALHRRAVHFTDYLKATVGGDREVFPINLSVEQLRGEKGIATATAFFQGILDQALILPTNEKNWLLRSSTNPDTGETSLLRPLNAKQEDHEEELLRPAAEDTHHKDI